MPPKTAGPAGLRDLNFPASKGLLFVRLEITAAESIDSMNDGILNIDSAKSAFHPRIPVMNAQSITIATATSDDREQIYQLRHEVYAHELGQHPINSGSSLTDSLDQKNHYLVAKTGDKVLGFVSITPPSAGRYSIEKYFHRDQVPFEFSNRLYEIRLLTVIPQQRNTAFFLLLGYAAYRWIESHGGSHVCGMGRLPLIDLYRRLGLQPLPLFTTSGALDYQLMLAPISRIANRAVHYAKRLTQSAAKFTWQFPFPFRPSAPCFHGGSFFSAIGTRFQALDRKDDIINADVLDAWFPPAPEVIDSLTQDLPWLLRTSPPTNCDGLIQTIAQVRGVDAPNILPGAGSSDLIFRAFRQWLTKESRVLILDPTYGEYIHVLEHLIGCQVSRLQLAPHSNYDLDLEALQREVSSNYDLIVLVNPNSPTGRHVPAGELKKILSTASPSTRIWIDETYIDYLSQSESLEQFAAQSENIIVCKSMSKVYALSGARAAYLCSGPHQLESLRAITPPWVIGLPSQLAAVRALENQSHYQKQYRKTHLLRTGFADGLRDLGWHPIPGVANFLLCQLPPHGPSVTEIIETCRTRNLFLRDPGSMGTSPNPRLIRIAVKDAPTNSRMLQILKSMTTSHCRSPSQNGGGNPLYLINGNS